MTESGSGQLRTQSVLTNRLVVFAMVSMAALIVALALQVRAMRPLVEELEFRKVFPYVTQWVSTERLVTLSGDTIVLGETAPGRVQIVMVFTSSCQYCLASIPEWKRLTSTAESTFGDSADVVWLSLSPEDSTRAYVARHGIEATVAMPTSWKMPLVHRLKAVPLTLVYDSRGRVAHSRPFAFDSEAATDSVLAAAARTFNPDSVATLAATDSQRQSRER